MPIWLCSSSIILILYDCQHTIFSQCRGGYIWYRVKRSKESPFDCIIPHDSRVCNTPCALFWCWVSLCVPFINSLTEFYFIMLAVTTIGLVWPLFLFWNTRLGVLKQNSSGSTNAQLPGFPSLDISFEYWIEHVSFGLLYVMFRFYARIFYMGVSGFANDCPCGVWRRD